MFRQNNVDWVISLNNICNIVAILAVVRIDISDEKVIYSIFANSIDCRHRIIQILTST